MPASIPTFSLTDWRGAVDEHAVADHLVEMCHGVGFFYLADHGVPDEFLDRYFRLLAQFFALPMETKALIDKRQSPHFRGWERVGAELTNNRVDHREQLDVSTEHPAYPADVEPAYLRLDGPNQWLPDHLLPGFHEAVDEFFARMGNVAWELMEVMSTGLGLPRHHLRDLFGERPLSFVKLISYPRTPPGEAGVNAHHDAGFLTLLLQRGVGGLQALSPDGDWIDIDPPPGAIIVNIGEMLQAMTGNYFVACTHRVITNEPRFSSAYSTGRICALRWPRWCCRPASRRPSPPAHAIGPPGSWPSATSCWRVTTTSPARALRSSGNRCGTTTCAATRTWSRPTSPAPSDRPSSHHAHPKGGREQ